MTRLLARARAAAVFTALALAAHGLAGRALAAESARDVFFPLPVYEKLTYSVEFGIIRAGNASLEIRPGPKTQACPTVELISRARSSSFFNRIYPVDDQVGSVADAESLLTIRFEKRLLEGTYRAYEAFAFEREAGVVRYASGDTVGVPPGTRDVLAAFYDVRRRPLVKGKPLTYWNHSGKKTLLVRVDVLGHETIETRVGKFRCVKIQPIIARGGLFKNEGSLWIWLTDDERRIPVKMQTKLRFGSITTEIERIERPDLFRAAKQER